MSLEPLEAVVTAPRSPQGVARGLEPLEFASPRKKRHPVTRLSGMAKRKAGASPPAIEGADKKGKQSDAGLRGDDAVVQQRRKQQVPRRAAERLAADERAVKEQRGVAKKTAEKVATDDRAFDDFVAEQRLVFKGSSHPSVSVMVRFAAWMTRRRERACLVAQRVDGGPRLTGLVRTTIKNMLTELV